MKSLRLGSVLLLLGLAAGALLWRASGHGEARELGPEQTSPHGHASLERSSGELSSAGRDARRDAVEPDAAARTESTSALPPFARLFGRFTEVEDGRALVGLELGVRGASGVEAVRTAADGSFAFELVPGTWTFFLRPPPGLVPLVEELTLAPGEQRELSRALGAARTLCVRVWRAELGRLVPCADAEVWLIQGASDGLARTEWPRVATLEPVRTDREGHAELAFADSEQYVLTVEREGHVPYSTAFDFSPFLSWTPFSPDGCIHVVLEEAGASVHGRVLDPDGLPLAGALVAALDGEGLDGRHALSLAPPPDAGEIWLQPSEFPAFATSASDGGFALALPRRLTESMESVELIAMPGSEDLVHHIVQPLSAAEILGRRPVELRLPSAGEVELEFVDESGLPRNGVASVRDLDGLGHGDGGSFLWLDLDPGSAARRLLTRDGRVRLRHPGGPVRVGLSPDGRWDEREFELEIPAGPELRRLRVVVAR